MTFVSIGIKANLIASGRNNFIDYVVIAIFALAMRIPNKYSRKALPNVIKLSDVVEFKKGKRKSQLILKQKYSFNLKVPFKNKFLPKDLNEHLNFSTK